MTDEELRRWRKLCDEASPEPWLMGASGQPGIVSFDGDDVSFVAACSRPQNYKFIITARSALPELLDEVKFLRAWKINAKAVQESDCESRNRSAANVDLYRAECLKAEARCDEARAEVERLHRLIRTVPHIGHLRSDERGNPTIDEYDPCCPACWLGEGFPT